MIHRSMNYIPHKVLEYRDDVAKSILREIERQHGEEIARKIRI